MEKENENEKENLNHEDIIELLELTRENNAILKKIRRNQIASHWLKTIYWIIIIIALFIAYNFLEPYISSLTINLNNIQKSINTFSSLTQKDNKNTNGIDLSKIQQVLKSINK